MIEVGILGVNAVTEEYLSVRYVHNRIGTSSMSTSGTAGSNRNEEEENAMVMPFVRVVDLQFQ